MPQNWNSLEFSVLTCTMYSRVAPYSCDYALPDSLNALGSWNLDLGGMGVGCAHRVHHPHAAAKCAQCAPVCTPDVG